MREITCPACELRCVVRINWDAVECPEHGWISGVVLAMTKGMASVDALIEILSAQRKKWSYGRFRSLEGWLHNDSFLKIRVPHL